MTLCEIRVFTAVSAKIMVFCDIIMILYAVRYQHFGGGTCYLYLQTSVPSYRTRWCHILQQLLPKSCSPRPLDVGVGGGKKKTFPNESNV